MDGKIPLKQESSPSNESAKIAMFKFAKRNKVVPWMEEQPIKNHNGRKKIKKKNIQTC